MSTANRTRASMSFRQMDGNGNPCAFAALPLIGDAVGIKVRPAVDPLDPGVDET